MNGYISNFDIYQGKNGCTVPEGYGLGERVVLNMTDDLGDKHYKIYFDNNFTSPELMIALQEKASHACRTVRLHRKGLPANIMPDKSLLQGEFDYRVSHSDLVYYKWMDNKAVHLLWKFLWNRNYYTLVQIN